MHSGAAVNIEGHYNSNNNNQHKCNIQLEKQHLACVLLKRNTRTVYAC